MSNASDVEDEICDVASNSIEKRDEVDMTELFGNVQEEDEEEHDEDGDDEEEDDGDEDADGNHTFAFEEEMDNPFAVVDGLAIEPCQQFDNEYEALADKKRKALAAQDSQRERLAKNLRLDEITGKSIEDLMDFMSYGRPRKSRKSKKRGRRKGSRNKPSPEVTRKLGDANLHYVHGQYEEAISVLHEVICIDPCLPDSFRTLALIYEAMGDKPKALDFFELAAYLTPKDAVIWKRLFTLSREQGNVQKARLCLGKAIKADPSDIKLRFLWASLCEELGEYQKAAESYKEILQICPEDLEALEKATLLLTAIYMRNGEYTHALKHIEHVQNVCCGRTKFSPYIAAKEGICHAYLEDTEKAESIFSKIWERVADDHPDLLVEVADSLMARKRYATALKYYLVSEGNGRCNSGFLHENIAGCYLHMNEKELAIEYLYKALRALEDNVDVRLTLATLLLEENKEEEAILVLSPPKTGSNPEFIDPEFNSHNSKPWWLDGRIKFKLCRIYQSKGKTGAFVDAIFPSVRESLLIKTKQKKVKRKLLKSELSKRAQVLPDQQTDSVFRGRPVASSADLLKATRAKKLLQKRKTLKEERKATVLAAGLDWKSEDSDEDNTYEVQRVPPLPNLLKDEEHYQLIIDLCKALISSKRFLDAMEVITLTLKLASTSLSIDKQKELQHLGAQVAYSITDPTHGWDYALNMVKQHPRSFAAWNCYYRAILRLEKRFLKYNKFLHYMRGQQKDIVPPILICGHQLTMGSKHQAAAVEYLEAYKLMPYDPLINLCAGSALINLSFGHRLHNKHQCLLQGFSFLYNNLQLCENSQESLYNIARAYHHVGLVALAAAYYEKVLAVCVKDYPIPKIPMEEPRIEASDNDLKNQPGGYCDLRREAAHNLHLIYKNSGAFDLARQVLKDHCAI